MIKKLWFSLVLMSSVSSYAWAKDYFVIVRGSSGWQNYRHEADVYHLTSLLLGPESPYQIPRDQVVVMTYNDIAYNSQNPRPGFIENRVNGTNVYLEGFVPDYSGDQVTPENFISVLRNLKSTRHDNVWIYFTDHGGTNLIAFPNSVLYADDLNETLQYMYANGKYNKLIFYLEACESGSMFNHKLPKDIDVYAVTAATPNESSYACCYDNSLGVYTGDEWSVNFLEDLDSGDLGRWTFDDQYDISYRFTTQSTPCQYGNTSIADAFISGYIEGSGLQPNDLAKNRRRLKNKLLHSNSTLGRQNWLEEGWTVGIDPDKQHRIDQIFAKLVSKYALYQDLIELKEDNACDSQKLRDIDMPRYKELMKYYPDLAYLRHTHVLAILCLEKYAHIDPLDIILTLLEY